MPKTIFISYRRDDEPGFARALHLALERRFPDAVFFDIDIPAGDDFTQVLDAQIDQCDVLLPVIGRRWLELKDREGKRRLDNPNDYVRFEIGTALKKRKRIIPVLVNNASMPADEELPYNLQGLAKINARTLTNDRFEADINAIANAVETALRAAEVRRQRFQADLAENPHGRNWALGIVADPSSHEAIHDALRHVRPELEMESPVHGQIGGSQLRQSNTFWRDTSLTSGGIINLITNVILNGLGVRFVIEAGSRSNSVIARSLDFVLRMMVWTLALGYIPLVLCSMLVGSLALAAFHLFEHETFFLQIPFVALGTLGAGLVFYRVGMARLRDSRIERPLTIPILMNFCIFCIAFSLLLALDHPRGLGYRWSTPFNGIFSSHLINVMSWFASATGNMNYADRLTLLDETGRYIAFLQLLRYFVGSLLTLMTVYALGLLCLSVCLPTSSEGQRRRYVLAVTSVVTMWALTSFVLWPENVLTRLTTALFSKYDKSLLGSLGQFYTFSFVTWSSSISQIKSTEDLQKLMPLLLFDVLFLAFILMAACAIFTLFFWRKIWKAAHRGLPRDELDRFRPETDGYTLKRPPRLILSGLYQTAALMFIAAVALQAIAHFTKLDAFILTQLGIEKGSPGQVEVMFRLSNVALVIGFGVALLLLFTPIIRQGALLIIDALAHITQPSRGFPSRQRNIRRLEEAITDIIRADDRPHLVLICHGQGATIMLDTLFGYRDVNERAGYGLWHEGLKDRVASLTLLTFGAPITHIYQYYFANLYPRFSTLPSLCEASRDPRLRWFNCYRIDDYVGTHIDPSIAGFPVNIPMPVGGHNRYWTREIFTRLFAEPGMERVLIDLTVPFESDEEEFR